MAYTDLHKVFQWFLASTILLGVLVVVLIYPNLAILITHPPELGKRPFDVAFIHAPLRFFLVLPLTVMFPYSLLYVKLKQMERGLTSALSPVSRWV